MSKSRMPKSRTHPKAAASHPALQRVMQPLQRLLQSPYGIAAIASISFHGVVFALGSTLSGVSIAAFGEAPGEGDERTVPLVELSAAEQSRLPDFSARRSFTGRLPVPSSTPPAAASTTPQRSTGLRRSSPSLLNRQRTQSSTRRNPYVWNGSTRISRIPLPPSLGTRTLPTPPDNPPPEQSPEQEPDTTASTTTTGPDTTAEDLTQDPNSAESPANGAGLSLEDLQNPEGVSDNGSEDPSESSNPDDNQSPETGTDNDRASNDIDPEQLRLQELRDSLQWDDANTEADPEEITDWIAELQAGDETITAAEVTEDIDANIRVCVDNPPRDAIVGILLQPDGTMTEAALFQRTGYEAIDQAAVNAAANAVTPTEVPTIYQVIVSIAYDAESCIDPADMLG